jgi:hypothetical protein
MASDPFTALRRCDIDLETGTGRARAALVERSTREILLGPPKARAGRRVTGVPQAIIPVFREQLTIYVKDEPVALALGSRSHERERPSMNTPSAADRSGQIPDAAIPELARAATEFATRHGDSRSASITAVASSHGQAVEYASEGNQIMVGRDDPVYLVRVQGEFFHNMPRPHGAPLPPAGSCSRYSMPGRSE